MILISMHRYPLLFLLFLVLIHPGKIKAEDVKVYCEGQQDFVGNKSNNVLTDPSWVKSNSIFTKPSPYSNGQSGSRQLRLVRNSNELANIWFGTQQAATNLNGLNDLSQKQFSYEFIETPDSYLEENLVESTKGLSNSKRPVDYGYYTDYFDKQKLLVNIGQRKDPNMPCLYCVPRSPDYPDKVAPPAKKINYQNTVNLSKVAEEKCKFAVDSWYRDKNSTNSNDEWRRNCTTEDVPAEFSKDEINSLVGFLGEDDAYRCTATKISNNQIITAKHCFMNLSGLTPSSFYTAEKLKKSFFKPVGRNRKYQVCKSLGNNSLPYSYDSDLIIVEIAIDPNDAPMKLLEFVQTYPSKDTALYMPGMYLPKDDKKTPVLVSSSVKGCSVLSQPVNKCFSHSCQSVLGFSGAPVFIGEKGTGKLILAGVHLGEQNSDISTDYCIGGNLMRSSIGVSVVNLRR